MMVQSLKRHFFASAMVVSLATAAGAQQGLPSRATLEAMGLGGLEILSDGQALAVRGSGYKDSGNGGGSTWATAAGKSWASAASGHKSAASTNSYYVKANDYAFGKTFSHAGVSSKKSGHSGKNGHGGGDNGPPAPSAANGNYGQSWSGANQSGNSHSGMSRSGSGGSGNHGGGNHGGGKHSGSSHGGGNKGGNHSAPAKVKVRAGGFSYASV